MRWGIVADASPLPGLPPNRAIVMVGHYAVTLPACPNWSMRDAGDFSNAPTSNFGCATAVDLGLMVASPGDLSRGRRLAEADGKPAAAAVDRYLNDKVHKLPAETSLGADRRGWRAVKSSPAAAAAKPSREGILAVTHDQPTLERLDGVIRELQLDDELSISDTADLALRRIRSGLTPRILLLDIADLPAPIVEIAAARAVGGADLALIGLGAVNDVALYRELLAAGANDYLVKPPTRDALAAILQKPVEGQTAKGEGGLGQLIAFVGNRGGVGATTAAVGCAWLLAEDHAERTALLDLDLHFGTVALKLDTEPGSGLFEALEQPSRIDSLFIERAMVKITDNLRVLATEASVAQHLSIDAGAIDMLLYELRRKFARVVVDLPRGATPVQRVVLGAASHVVMICERSLAGLRDAIRLQALMREQAPQVRLWLVEAGANGSRALIGASEFQKGIGRAFDMTISFDPKSAGAAINTGQPLPVAAPRSPVVRELRRLAERVAGRAAHAPKRRLFAIRSLW